MANHLDWKQRLGALGPGWSAVEGGGIPAGRQLCVGP